MTDVETKGRAAADILESSAYKEAVEFAKARIKNRWELETDPVERESLWNTIRAIGAISESLEIMKGGGIRHRHDRERTETKQ